MLVLQPVRVHSRATLNDAPCTQSPPTTPPPFYHRTPPPTPEELQFFGLQAATPIQSQGIRCTICQGSPEDPVLSRCNHIFCFGCVYQWFGRSTFCPKFTRDLYQPRKLRGQPSREIHPAERSGHLSTSQWTRALSTATSKVQSRRNSVEHKVLVKKTRHIACLQVPQTSHHHTQSDRATSATHKQRTPPPAVNNKNGHTRRHSSLPTYGKSEPRQRKPDYSDKGPPVVIVHQDDHSINNVENLDTAMVEVISTCSKYLEREQQAVSVRVIHIPKRFDPTCGRQVHLSGWTSVSQYDVEPLQSASGESGRTT